MGQIILESGGLRFPVVTALAPLVEGGQLGVDRRAARRPTGEAELSLAELEKAARGKAARGDAVAAVEMVQVAVEKDPVNQILKELLKELERSLFAQLSRDLLTSFRVPKLLTPALS